MKQRFALVGVAGYIAHRHLQAIKDTENELCVAYDKFDSVGRLDASFPNCSFFTENEQFDRFCTRQMYSNTPLQWFSICTPNYTHDAFIRYGLRLGCNVICEKPVVLNPYNLNTLFKIEEASAKQAYCILQLRLHPSILKLKREVEHSNKTIYDVDLTYITSRGKWYYSSWKGDVHKSGGVATNIGIHLYDMLQWVFGKVQKNIVHVMSFDRVGGLLILEKATVRYFLSISNTCLPQEAKCTGQTAFRRLKVNNKIYDFSSGFTDLHTESYRKILAGDGFRIKESYTAIEMASAVRNATPIGLIGDYHPLCKLPLTPHPFGWNDKI